MQDQYVVPLNRYEVAQLLRSCWPFLKNSWHPDAGCLEDANDTREPIGSHMAVLAQPFGGKRRGIFTKDYHYVGVKRHLW